MKRRKIDAEVKAKSTSSSPRAADVGGRRLGPAEVEALLREYSQTHSPEDTEKLRKLLRDKDKDPVGLSARLRERQLSDQELNQVGQEHSLATALPPPRHDYTPAAFRHKIPETPENYTAPEAFEVKAEIAWVAQRIIETVSGIAKGEGILRGHIRRDDKTPNSLREIWPVNVVVEDGGVVGVPGATTHTYTEADERALRTIYKILTGRALEDEWEDVLAQEMWTAKQVEHCTQLREQLRQQGATETRRAQPAPCPGAEDIPTVGDFLEMIPAPRSPAQILRAVQRHSPPGTVPERLNAEVIREGLKQTTLSDRGGGRGANKAKVSIPNWIKRFKRHVAEAGRERNRSKHGRPGVQAKKAIARKKAKS